MKNELTKTTFKSALGVTCHLISRIVCLGAVILVCSSAPAQNLFVSSDAAGGNIYEFTPNGVRSTFASGLAGALAFDKAGNLFVTTGYRDDFGFPINGSGKIYKLTPNGLRTTFASGLDLPTALAFDSAGNLFVANVSKFINGTIYKFTPAGGRTTFASGLTLTNPEAVAFDNAGKLFVSASYGTSGTGAIYKITSGGVGSTFAIGVSPFAPMSCDSADNLFVADWYSSNILKFTPSGAR